MESRRRVAQEFLNVLFSREKKLFPAIYDSAIFKCATATGNRFAHFNGAPGAFALPVPGLVFVLRSAMVPTSFKKRERNEKKKKKLPVFCSFRPAILIIVFRGL